MEPTLPQQCLDELCESESVGTAAAYSSLTENTVLHDKPSDAKLQAAKERVVFECMLVNKT